MEHICGAGYAADGALYAAGAAGGALYDAGATGGELYAAGGGGGGWIYASDAEGSLTSAAGALCGSGGGFTSDAGEASAAASD